MVPLEMAARFAAFTWYIENRKAQSRSTQAEARRFARQNWHVFLPVAHKGWGRLLFRVAQARRQSRQAPAVVSRPRKPQLAVMRH